MSEKRYAIVLQDDWVDALGNFITPYLLPANSNRARPILYAETVETQAPFVEATVTSSDGFRAVLRIPHHVVLLMVESSDRKTFGFIENS